MSLETKIELQPAIEKTDIAIIASNRDLSPAAGTTLDIAGDVIGNGALAGVFLFKELEFPPLVHLIPSDPESINRPTDTTLPKSPLYVKFTDMEKKSII